MWQPPSPAASGDTCPQLSLWPRARPSHSLLGSDRWGSLVRPERGLRWGSAGNLAPWPDLGRGRGQRGCEGPALTVDTLSPCPAAVRRGSRSPERVTTTGSGHDVPQGHGRPVSLRGLARLRAASGASGAREAPRPTRRTERGAGACVCKAPEASGTGRARVPGPAGSSDRERPGAGLKQPEEASWRTGRRRQEGSGRKRGARARGSPERQRPLDDAPELRASSRRPAGGGRARFSGPVLSSARG